MMRVFFIGCISLFWHETGWGHIGDRQFPIYELTDENLEDINLGDGSVSDWEVIFGLPTITMADFPPCTLCDGISQEVLSGTLNSRIWLAWHQATNRIYVAAEITDDVFVNEYAGGDLLQVGQFDSFLFGIDGDHSGGQYNYAEGDTGCCETEEEYKRNNGNQAQYYYAISDAPDGRSIGYIGAGASWVNDLPYTRGGGISSGGNSTRIVYEFCVTPFDSLVWDDPSGSKISALFPGKVIGFDMEVRDFDLEPGNISTAYFLNLSGAGLPWKYAQSFVDGVLTSSGAETVLQRDTWGGIKEQYRANE